MEPGALLTPFNALARSILTPFSSPSQNNGDWLPIRPRYSTIADKLKQAGYKNHMIGKWCARPSPVLCTSLM